MLPRLYLETTIIGYLASPSSRDLITAANQKLTRQWWRRRRGDFALCLSEAVLREVRAGDPQYSSRRMRYTKGLSVLAITQEVTELAQELIRRGPLPPRAATDAVHIAVATIHRMDYLLTWNGKHIANAEMRRRVRAICEGRGHRLPVICTPAELMGG